MASKNKRGLNFLLGRNDEGSSLLRLSPSKSSKTKNHVHAGGAAVVWAFNDDERAWRSYYPLWQPRPDPYWLRGSDDSFFFSLSLSATSSSRNMAARAREPKATAICETRARVGLIERSVCIYRCRLENSLFHLASSFFDCKNTSHTVDSIILFTFFFFLIFITRINQFEAFPCAAGP